MANARKFILGDNKWRNWVSKCLCSVLTVRQNPQVGTAYELVLSDQNKRVSMNNPAPNTVTIPPNATTPFPVGSVVLFEQRGTGTTTIAIGGTDTLDSAGALYDLNGQYAVAAAEKTSANRWVLYGNLA
jgi:hypothetical protein